MNSVTDYVMYKLIMSLFFMKTKIKFNT